MKKYKYFFIINILFVFGVLNAWDYFLDKTLFNAMTLGLVMFMPVILLWVWGKFTGVVLITLISLFEFVVMAVFLVEGLELSGVEDTSKALFFTPYLVMAAVNLFAGLSIYSKQRTKFGFI